MKTEALFTPHMLAALKPRQKEYTVHDAGCPGLALRIQPSSARSWVMWERLGASTRRITLGRSTAMPLEAARKACKARQSGIASPQPPRTDVTFARLCALFMEAKTGVYRPSTLACLRCYLGAQLLPAFGATLLHRITTPDLAMWFYGYSAERPGGANAALIHFTTIFNWGAAQGHIPFDLPNPATPIRKNRRAPRGRMLNREELRRLWAVLIDPPGRTGDAAQAVRLMLLTGCRSGEILRLRWDEVRRNRLELGQTKTGPRTVMLSAQAQEVLGERRRLAGADYMFPAPQDKSRPRRSIDHAWATLKHTAGLPRSLRLHDLRHTYASHAVLAGESLYITGKLLGHKAPQSTERYAHLDGTLLAKAADKTANKIEEMMD